MDGKLHQVDVRSSRPHRRHLAIISTIGIPYPDRIREGEIASTVCGRFVRDFWVADDHSLFYDDGKVYAVECAACFASKGAGDGK